MVLSTWRCRRRDRRSTGRRAGGGRFAPWRSRRGRPGRNDSTPGAGDAVLGAPGIAESVEGIGARQHAGDRRPRRMRKATRATTEPSSVFRQSAKRSDMVRSGLPQRTYVPLSVNGVLNTHGSAALRRFRASGLYSQDPGQFARTDRSRSLGESGPLLDEAKRASGLLPISRSTESRGFLPVFLDDRHLEQACACPGPWSFP